MNSHERETIYSFFGLLFFILFMINFIAGCSHTVDKSKKAGQNFCFLDFDARMCWIDQDKNHGISFSRMEMQNRQCRASDEENLTCYYGITNDDMYDIMEIIYFKGNNK